jgi:hypothetical protein
VPDRITSAGDGLHPQADPWTVGLLRHRRESG